MSDKYYWMWREEKKKRQEAEGETTIVKAVGHHSPEMKLLQGEVEALKSQLHTDREKAQVQILSLEKKLRRVRHEE